MNTDALRDAAEVLLTNIDHATSCGAWRVGEGSQTAEAISDMRAALAAAPSDAPTTGVTHILKTDPGVFEAVWTGAKTFEIRKNDRAFCVGDRLHLRETKYSGKQMRDGLPLEYTGREIDKTVSHVLSGYGLDPDWVCLSFAAPQAAQPADAGEPALYQQRRKIRFNGQSDEWLTISKAGFFETLHDIEAGLADNYEVRRLYAAPVEAAQPAPTDVPTMSMFASRADYDAAVSAIDLDSLASHLRAQIKRRGLSERAAAREIGIGAATLGRMLQGSRAPHTPDLASVQKTATWLAITSHTDAAPAAQGGDATPKFKLGDHVEKVKGSRWRGRVVGTYSTTLTPEGYAVESDTEHGSVQIYPAAALAAAPSDAPTVVAFVDHDQPNCIAWAVDPKSLPDIRPLHLGSRPKGVKLSPELAAFLAKEAAQPAPTDAPDDIGQQLSELRQRHRLQLFDVEQKGYFRGVVDTEEKYARLRALPDDEKTQAAQLADAWPDYIAGVIETYLKLNKPVEERERAIAGIIRRRMHHAIAPNQCAYCMQSFVDGRVCPAQLAGRVCVRTHTAQPAPTDAATMAQPSVPGDDVDPNDETWRDLALWWAKKYHDAAPAAQGGDARPNNAVLVPADKLRELQEDAARYLWWCDPGHDISHRVFLEGKPAIDAAIDAALAAAGKEPTA